MNPIVWQGVYETFLDAINQNIDRTSTDIFTSRRWLDNALSKTQENQKTAAKKGPAPAMDENPLHVIASQVAKEKGCVRILDFGGSLGLCVPQTLCALPPGAETEFTIVDNAVTCAEGSSLFAEDPRVIFTETLPRQKSSFDIVHCGSSLHYIDDWRRVLEDLAGYEAEHLLFFELPAGEIPSFVSLQVYYEHLIPMRFWNIREFVTALEELDYELIFKTEYLPTTRGITGPLPMGNFPEEYRLEQYCHLLFSIQHPVSGSDL